MRMETKNVEEVLGFYGALRVEQFGKKKKLGRGKLFNTKTKTKTKTNTNTNTIHKYTNTQIQFHIRIQTHKKHINKKK